MPSREVNTDVWEADHQALNVLTERKQQRVDLITQGLRGHYVLLLCKHAAQQRVVSALYSNIYINIVLMGRPATSSLLHKQVPFKAHASKAAASPSELTHFTARTTFA